MGGVLVALVFASIGTLLAQSAKEANSAVEKGTPGASEAVELLERGTALAQYARHAESPAAMVAAVQMLRRARYQEGGARVGTKSSEPGGQSGGGAADAKDATPPPTLDTKVLLAEARVWAKGNQPMLAVIAAEEKATSPAVTTLGAAQGPVTHKDRVAALSIDSYRIAFKGREVARIAVIGDGDTDLDLHVFDEHGNEVGKDVDNTDQCLVTWTPKWSGEFVVKIANLGRMYNNYVLVTN
jgi:hypothetical protein